MLVPPCGWYVVVQAVNCGISQQTAILRQCLWLEWLLIAFLPVVLQARLTRSFWSFAAMLPVMTLASEQGSIFTFLLGVVWEEVGLVTPGLFIPMF